MGLPSIRHGQHLSTAETEVRALPSRGPYELVGDVAKRRALRETTVRRGRGGIIPKAQPWELDAGKRGACGCSSGEGRRGDCLKSRARDQWQAKNPGRVVRQLRRTRAKQSRRVLRGRGEGEFVAWRYSQTQCWGTSSRTSRRGRGVDAAALNRRSCSALGWTCVTRQTVSDRIEHADRHAMILGIARLRDDVLSTIVIWKMRGNLRWSQSRQLVRVSANTVAPKHLKPGISSDGGVVCGEVLGQEKSSITRVAAAGRKIERPADLWLGNGALCALEKGGGRAARKWSAYGEVDHQT